ncbi:MAG: AzlD domain-containing protein [Polaromonas sp.]
MNNWETVLAIVGLALITLVTRSFFLIPDREVPLPGWLRRSLRYAPLAALGAVLAPELFMRDGQLLGTLMDARLPAALLGMAFYFWQRSILGTIALGMAVYLPLHLGLGW